MKQTTFTAALTFFLALSFTLSACASKGKNGSSSPSAVSPDGPNPLVPRHFGPNYKYNELMIKDYDEVSAMVQALVKKAHLATSKEEGVGDAEAVEYLGRTLKLIYSRPDSDNMITKLVGEVRRDLQGFNSYEDTVAGIAAEEMAIVRDNDAPIVTQSSALVVLENLLADIRPEVQNGNAGLRRVVESIQNEDIRISDEVKRDRRLRGMFRTKNPSDEARTLLKSLASPAKK